MKGEGLRDGADGLSRECLETRERILAGAAAAPPRMAAHIEGCPSCRRWRSDVGRIHECCASRADVRDPSGLRKGIIESFSDRPPGPPGVITHPPRFGGMPLTIVLLLLFMDLAVLLLGRGPLWSRIESVITGLGGLSLAIEVVPKPLMLGFLSMTLSLAIVWPLAAGFESGRPRVERRKKGGSQ